MCEDGRIKLRKPPPDTRHSLQMVYNKGGRGKRLFAGVAQECSFWRGKERSVRDTNEGQGRLTAQAIAWGQSGLTNSHQARGQGYCADE